MILCQHLHHQVGFPGVHLADPQTFIRPGQDVEEFNPAGGLDRSRDAQAQVSVSQAITDKPLEAKVWRIDRVMDAASGTFTVLLRVPNEGNVSPSGIRCSVKF